MVSLEAKGEREEALTAGIVFDENRSILDKRGTRVESWAKKRWMEGG